MTTSMASFLAGGTQLEECTYEETQSVPKIERASKLSDRDSAMDW